MYLSRSDNRAANVGRKTINESALLDAIREPLEVRNKGEELVVFDETQYGSAFELFTYFNENVMTIIGPYGGAIDASSSHAEMPKCRNARTFLHIPTFYVDGNIRGGISAFADPSALNGMDILHTQLCGRELGL
ncbi:hypothetical protein DFS33DRAFT_1275606 [Desarmillaria ectypa]|nr:hypothetical protein DFS33DRAFT_1275606 [Desarmillaria ectypa]